MKNDKSDWIENYGLILVAFAHMTDWRLADAEIHVINEKLQLMLSQTKKEFKQDEVAEKMITILKRYHHIKKEDGHSMMESLLEACAKLKKEEWFDEISATVIVQFLAEIAESDHRIEKTEIQLLKNIADYFGIKPPRI